MVSQQPSLRANHPTVRMEFMMNDSFPSRRRRRRSIHNNLLGKAALLLLLLAVVSKPVFLFGCGSLFAEASAGSGSRIFPSRSISSNSKPTTILPTNLLELPKIPKTSTHHLYHWGNFGHVPPPAPLLAVGRHHLGQMLRDLRCRLRQKIQETLTLKNLWKLSLRIFRTWVFWYFSKDAMASIYEDRWHAERDVEGFFGSGGMWISKGGHKDVVRKRIQRSKRNRQWVGLGYTPRLVWLVGVLLRGTFQCTAIPKVFNPSLTGWGAGTILGAKCTHQEWIACFMIGWFGSEHYWRYLFGCNGPPFAKPGMEGIPVFITKIRNIRP